jgi:fido (protein-threonine AMPylation protein)
MADQHVWNQVRSLGVEPGINSLCEYERRVVLGAAAALVLLREPATDVFEQETVRLVHRLVFERVHPWAGTFRTPGQLATVSGYVAADAGRIGAELSLLSRRIECSPAFWSEAEVDAVLSVAFFHARFERIHPFRDGNGRVGRLLLAEQFRRLGSRMNIDWLAARPHYIAALASANDGDLAPLANLLLAGAGGARIAGPCYSPLRIAPRMGAEAVFAPDIEQDLQWSRGVPWFWTRGSGAGGSAR